MLETILATLVLLGVCLVVYLVVYLVVVSAGECERIPFNDRFPPLSDEEFLERCPPGTDPIVALKVRRIVADTSGIEYERIDPSSRFNEDLV